MSLRTEAERSSHEWTILGVVGFKGALMVCAVVAAAGVLATLIRGAEQQPAGAAVGRAEPRRQP